MRPFRFGVSAAKASSRAAWEDLARRVEGLGFSTLLVSDHVGSSLSPMPAMVSAASVTSTLRVGTLVLANDFRRPEVLAQEAATVDLLTDGRLELGIGAGSEASDYSTLGLSWEAGPRVARLESTVDLLRERLPSVPLLVAGNGRRILSLAARSADIVGLSGLDVSGAAIRVGRPFTAEGADDTVAFVRSEAGDRFESLELQALVQAVVPTIDPLRGELGDLSEDDVLGSPYVLVGSPSAMADALHERRERFGMSYFVVFAARGGLDGFEPLLAELAGR